MVTIFTIFPILCTEHVKKQNKDHDFLHQIEEPTQFCFILTFAFNCLLLAQNLRKRFLNREKFPATPKQK